MAETDNLRIDSIGDMKRTHDCGSLRAEDAGSEAVLRDYADPL